MSKLITNLGLRRDQGVWLWLKLLSVAGMIGNGAISLPYVTEYLGLAVSPIWQHRITALCVALLWLSGTMDTSPLPSAADAAKASASQAQKNS